MSDKYRAEFAPAPETDAIAKQQLAARQAEVAAMEAKARALGVRLPLVVAMEKVQAALEGLDTDEQRVRVLAAVAALHGNDDIVRVCIARASELARQRRGEE